MPKCKDCKYWDYVQKDGSDSEIGICRKYAPKPKMSKEDDLIVGLPRMVEYDWCGEFKAKE